MEKLAKIQFQVDEYTRLVEEETLIGKGLYFLRINKFFGVKLPWFWWLLKLGISLSFDKKYFARKSLSFRNIFAILIRLNQKCLKF